MSPYSPTDPGPNPKQTHRTMSGSKIASLTRFLSGAQRHPAAKNAEAMLCALAPVKPFNCDCMGRCKHAPPPIFPGSVALATPRAEPLSDVLFADPASALRSVEAAQTERIERRKALDALKRRVEGDDDRRDVVRAA